MPAIASLNPDGLGRLDQAGVNAPVLLFAFAAAILSALVAGVMPALRTARPDLVGVLKEGGRTAAVSRDRLRTILVGAEVSIAIVLLVGAGLLVRSAINLQRVDTGFDATGVLSARITLPVTGYEDPARVARTFESLAAALAASPGVAAGAVTSNAPMTPGGNSNGLVPEGKTFDPNDFVLGRLAIVTQDYLNVMRVPLVSGRFFAPQDRRGAPLAMVLSETAARLLFPGQDALGKRVACCEPDASGGPGFKVVVGIVGDVRNDGPQAAPLPNFYLPIAQAPDVAWTWLQRSMTVVVRGQSGDTAALTGVLRKAVRDMDPSVPVVQLRLDAAAGPDQPGASPIQYGAYAAPWIHRPVSRVGRRVRRGDVLRHRAPARSRDSRGARRTSWERRTQHRGTGYEARARGRRGGRGRRCRRVARARSLRLRHRDE